MNTSSNPADSKPQDQANLAIDATREAIAVRRAHEVEERARKRALDGAVRDAKANRKKTATAARKKDRKRDNQRDCRARKAAIEAARLAALPPAPPKHPCPDLLSREAKSFHVWLQMPGQRRTQLRERAKHYWNARVALLHFRLNHGRDPGGAEFARSLSAIEKRELDRYQGVYLLKQMTTFEGADGPWPAVTKNVETCREVDVSREV